jgi:hypothetical protein
VRFLKLIPVMSLFFALGSALAAQNEVPRFDASFQITALDMRGPVGEKALGIGGRFGYRLIPCLGLDAEVDHFPQNPSGNFGETLALFGVKVGQEFGNIGLFAKARAGAVHFGGSFFKQRLSKNTFPAVDLGGVIEFYPRRHFLLRLDLGDTIIPFSGADYLGPIGSPTGPVFTRLGTTHNLQVGFGLGFWF